MSKKTTTTDVEHAARGHHEHSPSSLGPKEACPQYKSRGGTSEAAEAGTRCHEAVEKWVVRKPKRTWSRGLTEEQLEAVERCIQYLKDARAGLSRNHRLLQEYRWLVGNESDPLTAGFADIVLVDDILAHIIDWKFGIGEVEDAETNPQGIAYLLGVFQKYPRLQYCTVHFVCPFQDVISTHTFSRADLPMLELRIRTIIARASDPTAEPRPSAGACIWCAKKATCKPLHDFALQISSKHTELVLPPELRPSHVYDPEYLAAGQEIAGLMESWAKAWKEHARNLVLTEGIEVPGYEIAQVAKRSITNMREVIAISRAAGVTDDELNDLLSLPLGKLETLVKARNPEGITKKDFLESFQEALDEAGATRLGQPFAFLRKKRKSAKQAQLTE